MQSLSSTNSVIIPGEMAYNQEIKMQMKHQLAQNQSNLLNVSALHNSGHRTSKSQSAHMSQPISQPAATVGRGTVRVVMNNSGNTGQLYL
jgi:hypothetical protein